MTTSHDRVEAQSAYVLHSRPYRETSALIDLFTEDFGRVSVIAKGVRQSKSRLRTATQSFLPLRVNWSGRAELKTLTAAEAQSFVPMPQGRALCCGLYLNELLVRLLPGWDAVPHLFAIYRLALEGINDPELEEVWLRIFEHRLLQELGIVPSFTHEGITHAPISVEQQYAWQDQQGFVVVDEAEAGRFSLGGDILLAIAEDDYSQISVRNGAKKLMRLILQQQLGDKPLASRALFAALPGVAQ